jgi:hypothetical protein
MLFTKLDRQIRRRELVELNDGHAWTTIQPALQIQQRTGLTRSGGAEGARKRCVTRFSPSQD